jgi:MFS family permease
MMESRRRPLVLALLCVAQFVDVLGVTIVVIALPSIRGDLGLPEDAVQWVVSIYALCFGGFLIVSGRAADIYGSRRLFAAGLGVFGMASLGCGLASAPGFLIAARAVQGLGAALAVPAALALLTTTFTNTTARARALAVWTAAGAGGGAAGFVLGGVITSGPGWRWVFLVNIPIVALSLAITPWVLTKEPPPDRGRRLDLAGAITLTAALLAVIFALTHAEHAGFGDTLTLVALAAAALMIAGFALAARRATEPLVPAAVLRSGAVIAANATALALTAVTSAAAVLGTLYAQQVLDLGPMATGLAFLPFSLAVIGGSAISPWVARHLSPQGVMATGLMVVAAAMLVISRINGEQGLALLIAGLSLSGLGLGVAAVASTGLGTSAVESARRGAVAGLLNTSTQLGTAIGVAVFVTVADAVGIRLAYVVAAAVAAAVALLVGATRRSSRPVPHPPRAPQAASPPRAASRPPWPTARRTPRASGPPRSASGRAWRGTSGRCDP